jgi:hypothetical protein
MYIVLDAIASVVLLAVLATAAAVVFAAVMVPFGIYTYGKYLVIATRERDFAWRFDIIVAPVVGSLTGLAFGVVGAIVNSATVGGLKASADELKGTWIWNPLVGVILGGSACVLVLASPFLAVGGMGHRLRKERLISYLGFIVLGLYGGLVGGASLAR